MVANKLISFYCCQNTKMNFLYGRLSKDNTRVAYPNDRWLKESNEIYTSVYSWMNKLLLLFFVSGINYYKLK